MIYTTIIVFAIALSVLTPSPTLADPSCDELRDPEVKKRAPKGLIGKCFDQIIKRLEDIESDDAARYDEQPASNSEHLVSDNAPKADDNTTKLRISEAYMYKCRLIEASNVLGALQQQIASAAWRPESAGTASDIMRQMQSLGDVYFGEGLNERPNYNVHKATVLATVLTAKRGDETNPLVLRDPFPLREICEKAGRLSEIDKLKQQGLPWLTGGHN